MDCITHIRIRYEFFEFQTLMNLDRLRFIEQFMSIAHWNENKCQKCQAPSKIKQNFKINQKEIAALIVKNTKETEHFKTI